MLQKYLSLLLISLILSGCSINPDYTLARPNLSYQSKGALVIGVHDQRPYILNKDKEENFVGKQTGSYGILLDIPTDSYKPLAEDMSTALVNALRNSDSKISAITLSPSLNKEKILQKLNASNSDKLLLLTLNDWKSNVSGRRMKIIYDLDLEVLNKKGMVLATKKAKGDEIIKDSIGDIGWNPWAYAKKEAETAYQQILEELFTNDIANALANP